MPLPLKLAVREELGDFMFQVPGNHRALVPSSEKNTVSITRRKAEPKGGFKNSSFKNSAMYVRAFQSMAEERSPKIR